MCRVPLQMSVMCGMLQTRGSTQAHAWDQATSLPSWLGFPALCPEDSLLVPLGMASLIVFLLRDEEWLFIAFAILMRAVCCQFDAS